MFLVGCACLLIPYLFSAQILGVSKEAYLFMESKPQGKRGAKGVNGSSWEAKLIRNGAELVTPHPGGLSHDITPEPPLFLLRPILLEKPVNWGQ